MIDYARRYIRSILRREHWWAEIYSGIILASFGLMSFTAWPHHLQAVAATKSFMILVPNGYWQAMLIFVGVFQVISLMVEGPHWRWYRGLAAGMAAMISGWITESEIIYAHGLQPAILFTAGWIGVNCFALTRIIGGLR